MCHEEMGGQHLLNHGAHTRERQMRLTTSAAFALEKAVGNRRQDHGACASLASTSNSSAQVL